MPSKPTTPCDICGKDYINVNLHKTKAHDIDESKKLVFIVKYLCEEDDELYHKIIVKRNNKVIKELFMDSSDNFGNGNIGYCSDRFTSSESNYSYKHYTDYYIYFTANTKTKKITNFSARFVVPTHRKSSTKIEPYKDVIPTKHYRFIIE